MSDLDRDHRLDHIVVVMFENRSFDNLLGYLYAPGAVPVFDGVAGRDLSNRIPDNRPDASRQTVPVHRAETMYTPDPDPGEEHPHVNTQLYGIVSPQDNSSKEADEMQPPFNSPGDPAPQPDMSGFVMDYVNTFQIEMGRPPGYDEYSQIMACYTPDQVPVISALAKGFACFDHWFCEVPTQTYANRSFFHAATSSGFVLNGPAGKFAAQNDAPTIFNRLEAANLSWRVYIDPLQMVPATGLIHAARLAPYFPTHFFTIYDFYEDAREGNLPVYSFIEPNMLHPHADMHPPGVARLRRELHIPPSDSLGRGERLLARVYDAVRTGSTPGGSNYANTLLLVTFDEHGGTFDHVPPPRATPPDPSAPAGEQGFKFDRLGVRIPTIAISAWIEKGTVVTREFRSTSVIRTLRERWSLGGPLTLRDADAPDIAPILSRQEARSPEDWPQVNAQAPGLIEEVVVELERPLARLERDLVGEALTHDARRAGRALDFRSQALSRREAVEHMRRIGSEMFPKVAGGRKT